MASGRKLRLRWVVFTDELQNLVLFDPELDRRVGVYDRPERVPSITLALTEGELGPCLEALMDRFERTIQTTDGWKRRAEGKEAMKRFRERTEARRAEQS